MSARQELRRAAADWRAASAQHAARRTAPARDSLLAAAGRWLLILLLTIAGSSLLLQWLEPCAAATLCMSAAGAPLRPRLQACAQDDFAAPFAEMKRRCEEACRVSYVTGWRYGLVCGGVFATLGWACVTMLTAVVLPR